MKFSTTEFDLISSRVRHTLDNGAQIDLSTDSCKKFLRRHVNQKTNTVVLYADIDGSTKMSINYPSSSIARVLQVFSQEISLLSANYGGYILKYVGDAVIILFPAEYSLEQACRNAIECAKKIHQIMAKCVNPELRNHSLPELSVKITIDYGDVLVVLYGKTVEMSHIDIIGTSISMASKMLSRIPKGSIALSRSATIASKLSSDNFTKLEMDQSGWLYTDEHTGDPYNIFLLKE